MPDNDNEADARRVGTNDIEWELVLAIDAELERLRSELWTAMRDGYPEAELARLKRLEQQAVDMLKMARALS